MQQRTGQAQGLVAWSYGGLSQLTRREHHLLGRLCDSIKVIAHNRPVDQADRRKQWALPLMPAMSRDVHQLCAVDGAKKGLAGHLGAGQRLRSGPVLCYADYLLISPSQAWTGNGYNWARSVEPCVSLQPGRS